MKKLPSLRRNQRRPNSTCNRVLICVSAPASSSNSRGGPRWWCQEPGRSLLTKPLSSSPWNEDVRRQSATANSLLQPHRLANLQSTWKSLIVAAAHLTRTRWVWRMRTSRTMAIPTWEGCDVLSSRSGAGRSINVRISCASRLRRGRASVLERRMLMVRATNYPQTPRSSRKLSKRLRRGISSSRPISPLSRRALTCHQVHSRDSMVALPRSSAKSSPNTDEYKKIKPRWKRKSRTMLLAFTHPLMYRKQRNARLELLATLEIQFVPLSVLNWAFFSFLPAHLLFLIFLSS